MTKFRDNIIAQREFLERGRAWLTEAQPAVTAGLIGTEPVSYYDSPGINHKCPQYQQFIRRLQTKPTKSTRDLRFLAVYELNASYNFFPDFYKVNESLYKLPPTRALRLRRTKRKTPEEQINMWFHDFLTNRNYQTLTCQIAASRRFANDPLVNTLKLKLLYINEDYKGVLRLSENLRARPLCWEKIDFKLFCHIQTGMALAKLKNYTAALKEYEAAQKLGNIMAVGAVINWNKACVFEKMSFPRSAARCLENIMELKTANFCGPRLIYIPQLCERIVHKDE